MLFHFALFIIPITFYSFHIFAYLPSIQQSRKDPKYDSSSRLQCYPTELCVTMKVFYFCTVGKVAISHMWLLSTWNVPQLILSFHFT